MRVIGLFSVNGELDLLEYRPRALGDCVDQLVVLRGAAHLRRSA